jgi:hypothetical protein
VLSQRKGAQVKAHSRQGIERCDLLPQQRFVLCAAPHAGMFRSGGRWSRDGVKLIISSLGQAASERLPEPLVRTFQIWVVVATGVLIGKGTFLPAVLVRSRDCGHLGRE